MQAQLFFLTSISDSTNSHPSLRLLQSNNNNSTHTTTPPSQQDPYEFVAFLLWYLLLVLCCIIPTCCSLRRRQMVDRRLAEQQQIAMMRRSDILLQSYFSAAGANSIQQQLQNQHHTSNPWNTEQAQERRLHKLEQQLDSTTTTITDKSIEPIEGYVHKNTNTNNGSSGGVGIENGEAQHDMNKEAESSNSGRLMVDSDYTTLVRLPQNGINANNRTIPGICAICLCNLEVGQRITWSPDVNCSHVFHSDCILTWLSRQVEPKCPSCRQDFCRPIQILEEDGLGPHDLPNVPFSQSLTIPVFSFAYTGYGGSGGPTNTTAEQTSNNTTTDPLSDTPRPTQQPN